MPSANNPEEQETLNTGMRPSIMLCILSYLWGIKETYKQKILSVCHAQYLVCHAACSSWICVVANTYHPRLVRRAAR